MRKIMISKQRGLNLVELMLAIVIGLFISLMVVQYFSTSSKLFKQQGVDSNLEANATFAMSYLSQYVRQAGSNSPAGSDVPFYTGDCDGDDPCTYNSDVLQTSDQIAIQMVPWSQKDCVGEDVGERERIANVFSIENSQLYCRGFSIDSQSWLGAQESLIDGIEQMQVLYGVSNDTGQIEKYIDASRVADGLSGNDALVAWDRVRSVKISLLVSDGNNAGTETTAARTYQLLDSPEVEYTDNVSRKVYTTTISINNKLQ